MATGEAITYYSKLLRQVIVQGDRPPILAGKQSKTTYSGYPVMVGTAAHSNNTGFPVIVGRGTSSENKAIK